MGRNCQGHMSFHKKYEDFDESWYRHCVEHVWNVMAHAQKPDLVFQRNGRVHLNWRGVSSVDYWQPRDRSQWPRGLRRRSAAARPLRLWVRIPLGHGCLSVVSVLCCQVEVSATNWSLVQRSPTDCGASLMCDLETSWIRRPWPNGGCRTKNKQKLAAEVCASAVVMVVMLDKPCCEVECKTTGYLLHSHVSPSLPLPGVTVCHQVSTEL